MYKVDADDIEARQYRRFTYVRVQPYFCRHAAPSATSTKRAVQPGCGIDVTTSSGTGAGLQPARTLPVVIHYIICEGRGGEGCTSRVMQCAAAVLLLRNHNA